MKKSNKKGFTLVELVIVIAVIAILAAVLIPTFSSIVKNAHESAALQAARNAYTEIKLAVNADLDNLTDEATVTIEAEPATPYAVGSVEANVAAALNDTGVDSVTYTKATATLEFVVGDYTVTYVVGGNWTVA